MTVQRILILLFTAFILTEARRNIRRRDTSTICSPALENTNKVQCYCLKDTRETDIVRSADCYLTVEDVKPDDPSWEGFHVLEKSHKLSISNVRGFSVKYIPTVAFKLTKALLKLEIKYGDINIIKSQAFANLSFIEEISLRDNQIQSLEVNAFSHHRDLTTINLDKNNIVEINRDVFVDLPAIEKIFLTSNKITTIHDRAFMHLNNLKELEINMNSIFSLNSETFSGLMKLQKLDLSSNSLEVIGDNTFWPLVNLKSLNLEGNKIQMLDEKAFNGLSKLQSLSLAHNKLVNIENTKVFEPLNSLNSLSLRQNEMNELKSEVLRPILSNLYRAESNIDLEDNSFQCDCRLDWLMVLKNATQSKVMKLALDNLKCFPDQKLRDMWSKLEEADKNAAQASADEEDVAQNTDYEYYDDTQLNGRLFYPDIRDLINCSTTAPVVPNLPKVTYKIETTTVKFVPRKVTTKATSSPRVITTTTPKPTIKITSTTKSMISNHGVLDLSEYDTTEKAEVTTKVRHEIRNEIKNEGKPDYTTSRLATVSAKPIESNKLYEEGMASDEAKPDKFKSNRSIQDDDYEASASKNSNSSSHRHVGCVMFISIIFCFRLLY